jgi:hypothetical protein
MPTADMVLLLLVSLGSSLATVALTLIFTSIRGVLINRVEDRRTACIKKVYKRLLNYAESRRWIALSSAILDPEIVQLLKDRRFVTVRESLLISVICATVAELQKRETDTPEPTTSEVVFLDSVERSMKSKKNQNQVCYLCRDPVKLDGCNQTYCRKYETRIIRRKESFPKLATGK